MGKWFYYEDTDHIKREMEWKILQKHLKEKPYDDNHIH